MAEDSNPIEDMRESVVGLAQAIIQTLESMPLSTAGSTLVQEAIRAAGQAGLLYREACRSKSRMEFYDALPTVNNAIEAVTYWMGLAQEHGVVDAETAESLIGQARATASRLTAARLSASRRSK